MRVIYVVVVVLLAGSCTCCDLTKCTGECRCLSEENPGGLDPADTPQFVMFTFDDAVTSANYDPTYKDLFVAQHKNPSGCNIGATYFVSHEYNNYALLHHLWRTGNEIAVHTITHEPNTEMWKTASYKRLKNEIVGMRNIISTYAQIPADDIKGFRAPFLQTAGNTTFQLLKDEGFMYDSSLATRSYAGLEEEEQPVWPFTLDHRFAMDCVIPPCPKGTYPGVWEVPLVSWFKLREVLDGQPPQPSPCSMVDACLPLPTSQQETFDYFLENFNRHYLKNRAPFPVFLHETWLKDAERKKGYIQFIEHIRQMPDVYIVPVQEVIEFIKNPQHLTSYKERRCVEQLEKQKCSVSGMHCILENTMLGGPRTIFVCQKACPDNYPWLEDLP